LAGDSAGAPSLELFGAQVGGLGGRQAQDQVEQRCCVRLYHEEEDLFEGNVEQRGADDDMAGVAPDAGANEVRVPGDGRGNSNLWVSALPRDSSLCAVCCVRTVMRKTIL
jgi:hypothetical protein